ncbi:MAG: hypothetical protein ACFCVA_13485 [Gammaproteobacteria bacterium]
MSRNYRLLDGDWEQFWEEPAIDDWEERFSAPQEFDEEIDEDLDETWESPKAHLFRCPRCGTQRLVDADSYRFFQTSRACDDCLWGAHGGDDGDEGSL